MSDTATAEQNETEQKKPQHVVTVKASGQGEKVELTYDFKATLQEAIEAWGEEAVQFYFIIGAKTALRNKASQLLNKTDKDGNELGLTAEQVYAELAGWKPEASRVVERKSDFEKLMSKLDGLTAEQREELIASLQG